MYVIILIIISPLADSMYKREEEENLESNMLSICPSPADYICVLPLFLAALHHLPHPAFFKIMVFMGLGKCTCLA